MLLLQVQQQEGCWATSWEAGEVVAMVVAMEGGEAAPPTAAPAGRLAGVPGVGGALEAVGGALGAVIGRPPAAPGQLLVSDHDFL